MKRLIVAGALALAATAAQAADGTVDFNGVVEPSCAFTDAKPGTLTLNNAGNVLDSTGNSAQITAAVSGGSFNVFQNTQQPVAFANNVPATFDVTWGKGSARGQEPIGVASGKLTTIFVDLKATYTPQDARVTFPTSNNYKATVTLTCEPNPTAAPGS